MIKEVKSTIPLDSLCKGIPKEFVTYLNYVRGLGFTEQPNYKYLKRLFRKLFVISGYDFDYRYDWVEDKYKKKSKKHSKFEDKKLELVDIPGSGRIRDFEVTKYKVNNQYQKLR